MLELNAVRREEAGSYTCFVRNRLKFSAFLSNSGIPILKMKRAKVILENSLYTKSETPFTFLPMSISGTE